jgi:hypothetical protein
MAMANSDDSSDNWLKQHMVRIPRKIKARLECGDEEKSDQTVLTAFFSS